MIRRRLHFFRGGSTECFAVVHSAVRLPGERDLPYSCAMEQAVASPPVKPEARELGPAPERLHALDAVRGGALLLGIVYHATISFIPTSARFWIVEDLDRSTTLAVLFFVSHVFRMTTFFLIAGFLAHMSFRRRGSMGFIMDRLIRIAVPLIVAWSFVDAALHALIVLAATSANGGKPARPPPFPTWC